MNNRMLIGLIDSIINNNKNIYKNSIFLYNYIFEDCRLYLNKLINKKELIKLLSYKL